jgi:uncharacterized protein (DUF1800 family)
MRGGNGIRATRQAGAWRPYAPSREAPWDLRRVVHLHRAAGFAATWGELQRDLEGGPEASVGRLLAGKARDRGVPAEFEPTAGRLAGAAVVSGDPARLKAWWVYRMLLGPDPLGERLTLLWHDHFATSNLKVDDLAAMRRQNETFRRHCRAPFGELLNAAVRDPALLAWLDAPANRTQHPNENLARELMELFTLGIGPYSEGDVRGAARALTGWTVEDGRFRGDPAEHDDGVKTILGRTGRWKGEDLVGMLLEHPACAARLARRIATSFLGEGGVGEGALGALAAGLRERDLDVGWAVETALRSEAFFAEACLGNLVVGPVGFVVGMARALELFDPPPSTLVLADWAGRLGQDLFYPPSVGGWPGGRSWLTTRSLIGRANFALALVRGETVGLPGPFDPCALARRQGLATDRESVLGFYFRLTLGMAPDRAWLRRLEEARGLGPAPEAEALRRAVATIYALPEAQLA